MGLEAGTYISDLNSAWPLGSDAKSTADDHIRLLKAVLQTTFPNLNAALTISSGTFTGTLTGMTGSVTVSCKYRRVGNIVVLNIGSGTGTSNAASMTMTGLPAAIQPATLTQWMALPYGAVQNNSTNIGYNGDLEVTAASGTMTFTVNGSTSFAASGTKGIAQSITVTYLLD